MAPAPRASTSAGLNGWSVLLVAALAACSHVPTPDQTSPIPLLGTDGASYTFPDLTRGKAATILVFFSSTCPCMRAHDGRLSELANRVGSAGGQLFVIDSEYGATLEADRLEDAQRKYRGPILLDPGARVAAALGAEYATYTVIFDAQGTPRYWGGFDSNKGQETEDVQRWASLALEDVLASRTVARPHVKTMGCALRRW